MPGPYAKFFEARALAGRLEEKEKKVSRAVCPWIAAGTRPGPICYGRFLSVAAGRNNPPALLAVEQPKL